MKVPFLNIRSAIAHIPATPDFVLPGLLPGSVGTVVGMGAVGKTTFLLQQSIAIASAMPAFQDGFALNRESGRVVFIAAEEPYGILAARLHAIFRWASKQSEEESLFSAETAEHVISLLEKHLFLVPAAGHSVQLVNNGERTSFFDELCQSCHGARLIVVDPLRRLHDGDENNSAAMTQVVQVLEALAQRTGAAVIAAHHMNKSAGYNDATDSASASRGSSALTDAVRWQVNLSGMTDKEAKTHDIAIDPTSYLRVDYAKVNYIAPPPPMWLKRAEGGVLARTSLDKKASKNAGTGRSTKKSARKNKDYADV